MVYAILDGMTLRNLHSALKAGCDRVYTFNLKDFRGLAPKELEGKIAAP